jgi:uncharacterized protein
MAAMQFHSSRHAAMWQRVASRLGDADLSHDCDHVARVYAWALRLAPEAGVDEDLAGAAALVHDLVIVPTDDPERALAGARSASEARAVLEEAGYDEVEIDRIAGAVRTSSWSSGLRAEDPLGEALQDADRLDAIGAVGVFRTFTCAQRMVGRGSPLRFCDPGDPLGRGGRAPDDTRYALDHFPVKLLRLADGMHLPSAREEARRRHATMVAFLDELERELREVSPLPGRLSTR